MRLQDAAEARTRRLLTPARACGEYACYSPHVRFFAAPAFDRSMRRTDVDGRLHVESCNISKANVCPYYGREIPNYEALGLDPTRIYQLYRDPDELAKAAPTFANLPLMIAHVPVSADEPQIDLVAGVVSADVRFEHPFLKASLAVWTAEGIALIESKVQCQLSSSYRYAADMKPGVSPDAVAFDGVMRDIIGNHVALVEEGRVGPDVIVNDSLHSEFVAMKFPKLLAAIKSALKSDADLKAVDAAVVAVAMDGKPKSTMFLRVAAAISPFLAKPADMTALAADAGIEKEMEGAADAEEDDEDKRAKDAKEEEEAAAKKKADDEAANVEPGPKKGEVGAALDAALKSGKVISAADARALADAAALDATNRINALHAAREDVKPLVGVIAANDSKLNTAEAVYRFALDHAKVAHKDVHASALSTLVSMAKQKATVAPTGPARMAADAVSAVGKALPSLSRFSRA